MYRCGHGEIVEMQGDEKKKRTPGQRLKAVERRQARIHPGGASLTAAASALRRQGP